MFFVDVRNNYIFKFILCMISFSTSLQGISHLEILAYKFLNLNYFDFLNKLIRRSKFELE